MTPYSPDFSTGNYMREYDALMMNIGIGHENGGNMITHEDFKNNCCFFVLDSSATMCNNTHNHPIKSGQIGVDIRFKSRLTRPVKLIAFQVYHSLLSIDQQRNVKITYL